jgi:UDP-3-O-[3-hydroxymyristoyl] glucosamine N-acyltransferase
LPIASGAVSKGDGDIEIVRIASLKQAQPGDLSFVANARYLGQMAATKASAVILGTTTRDASAPPCAVLRADDPYSAFARACRSSCRPKPPATAWIAWRRSPAMPRSGRRSQSGRSSRWAPARLSARGRSCIPTPSSVRGARIGDDCVIHAHVSIRERVTVGHRVVLQNGAVLGSDGYGFARQTDGSHLKIPQHADVVIEDDVEIGANSTVDRPAIGETRIRAGTKIDNLVHVAHGVTVGRRVLLAAQVGIAGSTVIGDDVMVAGQSGITGHIEVGRGVKVGAKSACCTRSTPAGLSPGFPPSNTPSGARPRSSSARWPLRETDSKELEQKIAGRGESSPHGQIPDR